MSEVSCRTCGPLVEALQSAGLPLDAAVKNLSLAPETISQPAHRIRWHEYLTVLENVADALGGVEALEETTVSFYARVGGVPGVVSSRFSDARPLYHEGARWCTTLYSVTRATSEDLPDGRVRQTIEILPGHGASELFFRCVRAGLRAAPRTLGQREAQVEMEISGQRATYVITPPPALPLWGRLRRALRRRRDFEQAERERTEREFQLQKEEVLGGLAWLERTQADLDVKKRELEAEQLQRRQAEQLMLVLQANKLATIGELSGGIAHDFNNILTTILGYVDVALDGVDETDRLRPELDEIRAIGERGAGLVEQLLSVGRPQPVMRRRISLNEVVREKEALLRRLLPAGVRLSVLAAPEPLEIVADPVQVEQIVLNLAINARDAMPDGGRLDIEMRRSTPAQAGAGPRAPSAGYARLEVRDTGRGMDAATRSNVFEPYFTTKPAGRGSGLGLASVHSIVTSANGTIQLHSEPGQGTRVVLHFPLAEAAAEG